MKFSSASRIITPHINIFVKKLSGRLHFFMVPEMREFIKKKRKFYHAVLLTASVCTKGITFILVVSLTGNGLCSGRLRHKCFILVY